MLFRHAALEQVPDRIIVNRWLAGTTQWYGMSDAKDGDLCFYFAWEDEVHKSRDEKTQGDYVSVDFSMAHGAVQLLSLYKVA